MGDIGHCRHGEFKLLDGCPKCVEEARAEREAFAAVGRPEPEPPVELDPEAETTILITNTVAVVRIAPHKDPRVQALFTEVMRIREWAVKLMVASIEDAQRATNDLSIMGKLKKAVEEKRREYVDPLNEHVKAVNESFKLLTGPLGEADKTVRDKMLAFNQELQRRQREAEEINRAKEELARKEAALNYGEVTIDTRPVEVPEAPRLTRTDQATAGMVENWKYEVVDIDLLPREYMMPDEAMLTAIAKKYHDQKKVTGVRFYSEQTLRIRPR